MNFKTFLLPFLCLILVQSSYSQRKNSFSTSTKIYTTLPEKDNGLKPFIKQIEVSPPDGYDIVDHKKELKVYLKEKYQTKRSQKFSNNFKKGSAENPKLDRNFNGNPSSSGVPLDNDLCISDSNFIFSVVNSSMAILQDNGKLTRNFSMTTIFRDLNFTANKFDPRIMYDKLNEKIVLVCLNGNNRNTSEILIAYGDANNPYDPWAITSLPGNPYNDTLWTDYPIMSIANNQLYITGNFIKEGVHWSVGFNQSVIWQIDLPSLYNDNVTDATLWDSIFYDNKPIRNICPLKNIDLKADNQTQYFVSNRNQQELNDSLWVLQIKPDGNGDYELSHEVFQLNEAYGFPPNALQSGGNHELATNDARWLGGYHFRDQLHFVSNTIDTIDGKATIYHGQVKNISSNPEVLGHVIRDSVLEFGYPSITWAGTDSSDFSSMIALNSSSAKEGEFPACGIIYVDNENNYSDYIKTVTGSKIINQLSGTDRWGDYLGIQHRYGSPGEVWIAGTYGGSGNAARTRIGRYLHPNKSTTSVSENSILEANVYPNPFTEKVEIIFNSPIYQDIDVYLYNNEGKRIHHLLSHKVKSGKCLLHFDKYALAPGNYILSIEGKNGVLLVNKRVIKK